VINPWECQTIPNNPIWQLRLLQLCTGNFRNWTSLAVKSICIFSYKYFTPRTMWFVVRKRSKHRTPRPVIRRKRYLQNLNVRLLHKNTPILSAFRFQSNGQEFHVDVVIPNFNCYNVCYNTSMATDIIVLGPTFLEFGKRIEVCITCDKVL
jgi:hypothetical protein